jgi:hypothetical protein
VKAGRPALDAAGRAPVVLPATIDKATGIIILQRIATGGGTGTHVLVLDAAALARPALEPIAAAGAVVALTARDGKALAAAGAPGGAVPVVKPLPWGGGSMNVSVGLPMPAAVQAMFAAPAPDRMRSILFAIVTSLGLLVVIVAAMQRGNRSS